MFIGKRIKEKRLEYNYTQEQLGALLNVSKVSICNWENDVKYPSSKNLIQLSKILNTPVEYLVGNDTYVVSSNDENYGLMLADEEIALLEELRLHKKLYDMLLDSPKRTIDRIEKNLF